MTYEKFWNSSVTHYGRRLNAQNDFYNMLITSAGAVRDFVYLPDNLIPTQKSEFKISNINFSDCSFAKTNIENIEFYNCKFYNCKFNLSKFKNCKFHDCKFTFTNMFKVEVEKCYWDADFFYDIIPNYSYFRTAVKASNICVTFFQTLYHNAKDSGQEEHQKNADYHFKKWKGLNLLQKRFVKLPYTEKISWSKFSLKYLFNLFQYIFTGYGYRVSNFIMTFIVGFIFFLYINHSKWAIYKVHERDVPILSFHSDSANIRSSVFYTLDATTKLIDSQMQPTSDTGMIWLSIQGVFGFLLLSGLITIILNKFVK